MTPMSLQTTRERKEKGGERGEKEKGLLALIIFILPTLDNKKSARDTPAQTPRPSGTVFKNPGRYIFTPRLTGYAMRPV